MPDQRLAVDAPADHLIAIYSKADRDLRKIIRDAAARGAEGTAGYFARQQRKVRAILGALQKTNVEMVPAVIHDSYMPAAEAVDAVLDESGIFEGGPHEGAIQAISQAMQFRLNGAVRTVGRRTDDVFRKIGTEEVAQGLVRGDTRRGVSMRIRRALADEGLTAFYARNGAKWQLGTYATMVARTTTREAVTVGTVNRLKELGSDLVSISHHPQSCPQCLPFDGKTYSMSGTSGRYPHIPQAAYPPIHPNCKHVLHPAAATFEEFEAELGLAPGGGGGVRPPPTPPPAPPAPPQPPVGRMSDAVNIAPLGERRLRPAVDAIDRVHRVPAHMTESPLPIRSNSLPGGRQGAFRSNQFGPVDITVDPAASDEVAVTLHELGHYFDYSTNSTDGTGRETAVEQRTEALDPWREAIEGSARVQSLRRALRISRVTVMDSALQEVEIELPTRHRNVIEYLLAPVELWARAYAQWVSLRSGQYTELRTPAGTVVDQWQPDDFEPIARAMDDYFEAKGLLGADD